MNDKLKSEMLADPEFMGWLSTNLPDWESEPIQWVLVAYKAYLKGIEVGFVDN